MEHFRKKLFATVVHSFNFVKSEEKHDLLPNEAFRGLFVDLKVSRLRQKWSICDKLNEIQNI